MNQELIDRCPFREKTASRRLYLTLARADGALTKAQIAKAAHLTVAKAATLLAAYLNPMHKAPLDRVGVRLVRAKDGGYSLESCKPKPNAKRPARGEPKRSAKNAKKRPVRAESKSSDGVKAPRKKRTKKTAGSEAPAESLPPTPPMVSEATLPGETAN